MDRNEDISRKFVLRAYGVVSLLQLLLGLLLIISGLLALKYSEEFHILRPPYYLGAFLVGILIICAGITTLYIYMTDAPLIDYYFLEEAAVRRIRQSVTANTIFSILSLLSCLLGLFICIVFAIGPCDSKSWLSQCSYYSNTTENEIIAIFVTVFLSASLFVSIYSSLMSCIHGWVFDFDVIPVKIRQRKLDTDEPEDRPVSTFQPVGMFDIEEHFDQDEDIDVADKYKTTSSFKMANEHKRHPHEHDCMITQHEQTRKHIPPPRAPQYVAVLNDPAMKQKLKERNSRLQDQFVN